MADRDATRPPMRLTTVLLVLLWPLWLYAAQSPSGQIAGTIEGPDGPVAGVTVILAGETETRETRTDSQGRYAFGPLAPGRYRLTAATAGLQATHDVAITSADNVQVPLTLKLTFTDTAIVTASRDRESLLDAAAAVSVVGEREIAASASFARPRLA